MGIYRWMKKLYRMHIATEVSMLLLHVALPQQGHLQEGLRVMSYLSLHHNLHLCMDPTHPTIDSTQFPICDWSEFYSKIEEPIPTNAPDAIGKVVDHCIFVNSDHASNQHTHRLHSGFLIYLNTALISWCLKRQSTIKTCTFCAEFLAMKTGVEVL